MYIRSQKDFGKKIEVWKIFCVSGLIPIIPNIQQRIPIPGPKSFWRSSEELDLTKIFYEDLHKFSILGRSSLNFFGKPFEDF